MKVSARSILREFAAAGPRSTITSGERHFERISRASLPRRPTPLFCVSVPQGLRPANGSPYSAKNAHYRVKSFVFRSAVIATLRLSTLFAVEWDTNAESSLVA